MCIIGASSVNTRRNAALATAYSLSESAFKEYREKVVENIGDKKEQTIKDAIAKEKIEKNPVQNTEVILTGKGETLCYDVVSGRYFKSDIDRLKKAENKLNRQMRDEMYISLNDFYYEIGLDNIKVGDNLGWNIDDGYIDLRFSSQLATDGTPCLVIDYGYGPRYDFRNLM
jgi:predicted metal-dependent phosphotriesterase family hydrolase